MYGLADIASKISGDFNLSLMFFQDYYANPGIPLGCKGKTLSKPDTTVWFHMLRGRFRITYKIVNTDTLGRLLEKVWDQIQAKSSSIRNITMEEYFKSNYNRKN